MTNKTIEFKQKVRFGDLSPGLKVAIVLAWIAGIIEGLAFIAGFMSAWV